MLSYALSKKRGLKSILRPRFFDVFNNKLILLLIRIIVGTEIKMVYINILCTPFKLFYNYFDPSNDFIRFKPSTIFSMDVA